MNGHPAYAKWKRQVGDWLGQLAEGNDLTKAHRQQQEGIQGAGISSLGKQQEEFALAHVEVLLLNAFAQHSRGLICLKSRMVSISRHGAPWGLFPSLLQLSCQEAVLFSPLLHDCNMAVLPPASSPPHSRQEKNRKREHLRHERHKSIRMQVLNMTSCQAVLADWADWCFSQIHHHHKQKGENRYSEFN